MIKCDDKCILNWDTIPSICLQSLLLVYITVLIYKTTTQNRIFNFILAMLIVLEVATVSNIVMDVLDYKQVDYLELYESGIYTPE